MLSLALFTIYATALAAPASDPAPPSTPSTPQQILPPGYVAPWQWHVSGWEAGCARSGCSYNFNVAVPPVQGLTQYGEFHCNGYENGGVGLDDYYVPCQSIGGGLSLEAAARFRRRQADQYPQVIEVSVLTPGAGDTIHPYNFTAYGHVTYNRNVAPAIDFDILPTVWQQLPYPALSN